MQDASIGATQNRATTTGEEPGFRHPLSCTISIGGTMVAAATPLVEFRDVAKRYGAFTALSTIDLDVGRGEFLTLLGPSGSGKTTALMLLAGFEKPSAGTILFEGRP